MREPGTGERYWMFRGPFDSSFRWFDGDTSAWTEARAKTEALKKLGYL